MTRHIDIEAQFIIPGKNHFVFYPKDSKFIYDFDADDSKITIAKADGTAMDAGAITTFSSYNILQNIGNAKSPQYVLWPDNNPVRLAGTQANAAVPDATARKELEKSEPGNRNK
eukprot:GHVT01038560.1.p1 GENE.GHVT01038560.1~~GHVT01038560.1.p1  ORF type:complete len:114 (-),score=3.83 GHVT01038560.1:458-799(-)